MRSIDSPNWRPTRALRTVETGPNLRGPILVSLGSNVEPVASIGRALAELKRASSVTATSAVYRSAPVGAPGTPDFYNAALELETDLGPRALKWDVLRPGSDWAGSVG